MNTPPAYEVHLERAAEQDLKSLQANNFQRIVSRIKELADTPRPRGCRKISGSKNDWRIRVGDYRANTESNKSPKCSVGNKRAGYDKLGGI